MASMEVRLVHTSKRRVLSLYDIQLRASVCGAPERIRKLLRRSAIVAGAFRMINLMAGQAFLRGNLGNRLVDLSFQ